MIEIYGHIDRGKFQPNEPELWDLWESQFKDGAKVRIEIKHDKETRRIKQNNLYWKWLEIIAEEGGFGKNELHSYFKYLYIARPLLIKYGGIDAPELTIDAHIRLKAENRAYEVFDGQFTTTTLTTKEFSRYMELVNEWSVKNYDLDLSEVKL